MSTAVVTAPRRWPRVLSIAVAIAVVVAVLVARRRPSAPAAPAPTERTTPWLENGAIRYPAAFAAREHVGFTPASETLLTPHLPVTGEVAWDDRRVASIGARIEGRISQLRYVEGETVRKGAVVAVLESVELGRAQAEVLKARAREQVARVDAQRERKLADARISPERDAQFAEAHVEALQAERVAAEKAVEALGGSLSGELGVLKLRSPIDGRIVELEARRGQTVSPTDTILVVADLRRVWVELTVFERDLPAIREGDRVEVRLPAGTGRALEGRVAHVGEVVDPERRAGRVRVELDNRDGLLRPGQSVTGVIHASGPRERRLSVPKGAVTRIDGRPTVFVRAGDDGVLPREVRLGPEDAEHVAVLDGLAEGEEVVTSGVLALKAELYR